MIFLVLLVAIFAASVALGVILAGCDSDGFGPDGPPRHDRPSAGDTGPR